MYSKAYDKIRRISYDIPNLVFFLIKLSKNNEPEEWEVSKEINMLHPDFTGTFAIFNSGKMIYSTWNN